jgi:phage terminase large subunit
VSSLARRVERASNPFAVLVARYARDPVGFVREVLGVEPDPWQLEALEALARGETRLSIRSGHGVGKSTFASWALIWFGCCHYPFKAVVTAPTAPQLWDALWAELLRWFRKLPSTWQELWAITSDRVELKARPEEAFISARTSSADRPEAMQGVHSAWVLLVVDEASGVPEAVFEAARGSMSTPGAVTVMLGNPTRTVGTFHRSHTRDRGRWWTRRVSSTDSPRVDPAFVADIADSYGLESNAYRVRVLGEFPVQEGDTLIGAGLVEEAMRRLVEVPLGGDELWGLDVARFGADASCLVKRRGNVVTEPPRRWRGLDTMGLVGAIVDEWESQEAAYRPSLIVVDVIGIGAGVADRLHELRLPVLGLNVAESPSTGQRYMRLRDEIWDRTKKWLESRKVSLPLDEQLRDDLVGPRYGFTSDGKLRVESKDEMRKRDLPSPDSADALCLTHCPAATVGGVGTLRDWRQPIKRRIRGV